MFGSQTRFIVLFALFVSVALATDYVFSGNFVETRKTIPNATASGKFYYLYSTDGAAKCRFRVEYTTPSGVTNLYQYLYDTKQQKSVLYSMCSVCTAESINEMPDKWWYDSSIYTKTSKSEGGNYWYDRKNPTKSSMVSSILMNGNTDPTATSVAAITFYDGRTFRISNFKRETSISSSDSRWKPASSLSCPTPTCSMFTDIVFVLDYSGSVSSSEWTKCAQFTIGVMNNFTFGDNAAAAACIQFNAPSSAGGCSSKYVSGCGYRCTKDTTYTASSCTEARTASVLAGADTSSGKTVSTNKADLINVMKVSRSPYGNTCQGFGLELAMKVFDRSPRSKKNPPPERIVIAITDGADHCPNRTAAAAKKLRETYGAFFVGVGVGLACNYDTNFIKSLTSTIAGGNNKAYFDVSDYASLNQKINALFTPLCEQFSSGCGPACKSFCGCGKCMCSSCNTSSNKCESLSCTARDGTSNGCVVSRKNCRESETTKCMIYDCNKNDGQCTVTDVCAATKKQYPYKCQSVTCKDGKCPVTFDDDFCKLKHKKDCEIWRCAHEGETPEDKTYGCVMVKNVTAECLGLVKKCQKSTCNTDTLSCDTVDECKKNNDKCTQYTCQGSGSSATCKVSYETPRPSNLQDDKCTKYNCFPSDGWKKNDTASLDAMKCRKNTPESERTCKIFGCDKNIGCTIKDDDACVGACKDLEQQCWSQASSTLKKCQYASCVGTSAADVRCNFTTSDCTVSDAAYDAERKNDPKNAEYDGGCYTYICSEYGTCEFQEVLPKRKSTACEIWTCTGDREHGWEWVKSYTPAYQNCKNDACYERVCDDEKGCIPLREICESKSNKCYNYTCKANKTCDEEVLLKKYDCMHEECSEDGTVIEKWDEDYKVACPELHNCTTVECPNTDKDDPNYGRCVYTNITHGDDPCTNYTCNTTDDTWIESPKCDDHNFCTEDKCSVDGECWTVDIDCYKEINMTEYPCFRAACKEDENQEKGYRCVRKLKSGAYIDICGRCIREGELTSSEKKEGSEEALACTEAPDEPMLKEGLAAASVAMIVLGAVIIGGALATTSVIGTKTLLERARAANNQSAHSNPLFEDNEAEMTNPTFTGEN